MKLKPNTTRALMTAGALALGVSIGTRLDTILPGDPVSNLEAVGDFAFAANAPGVFQSIVLDDSTAVVDSWIKHYTYPDDPEDTLVVAQWPLRGGVHLSLTPTHRIFVLDPERPQHPADVWYSRQPRLYPVEVDSLEYWLYELRPAAEDTLLWGGSLILGTECATVTFGRAGAEDQ